MTNKQIWIFGSNNGRNFNDNSKYLFEYCSNLNSDKHRYIWLSRSKTICNSIESTGKEAYYYYSLKGIYFALKSNVVVISNSFDDLSVFTYLFKPKSKTIVQLWHGTPLKVLENMRVGGLKGLLIKMLVTYLGRDCDFVISSTNKNIDIYKRFFNVHASNVVVTGQPRNDVLINSSLENTRNIWYMPTFREFDYSYNYFGSEFNKIDFDKFLNENNAILYIKLHHVNHSLHTKLVEYFKDCKNIKLTNSGDTYEQLSKSFALITDYSSVYYDYLLTNKPIIFTPFDYELYKLKRNFYYKYEDVTPGPKAKNWDDIKIFLDELFKGEDSWKAKRKNICKDFNQYRDNKSCARVYDEIISRNSKI